jgi:hypothetical protein
VSHGLGEFCEPEGRAQKGGLTCTDWNVCSCKYLEWTMIIISSCKYTKQLLWKESLSDFVKSASL